MDVLSAADEAALDKWMEAEVTIDVNNAAIVLKEVKQILEGFGVTFFLRQGTCLGAIRDNGFLPWDDDVDVGSVIGLHGVTEESLDEIVAAFRSNGFLTSIRYMGNNLYVPLVKLSIRCDWVCFRITDDYIEQFPFLKTPLSLITNLKEISFLGEKLYVPNPPEEYLRLKYGEDWQIPKKVGDFEGDVLGQVARMPAPNVVGKLRQLIAGYFPWHTSRIQVLDREGKPVSRAEVTAVGLGRVKTDRQGYARFYVPRNEFHPLIIRFGDYEETNYLQRIEPGETYVCRLSEKPQVASDASTSTHNPP